MHRQLMLFYGIMAAVSAAEGIYLFFCIRRMLRFYGADVKKKKVFAANFAAAVFLAAAGFNFFRTGAVIVLHLVFAFLLTDFAFLPFRILWRRVKKPGKGAVFCRKIYQCGMIPVLSAALIFFYGWYNMNHIRQTSYQVKTEKQTKGCRIVLLTDVHYDTVQNADVIKSKTEEIRALRPDLVILGGDIVEEGPSKEKMQEIFRMLGGIESRYGVYYVYGNHDRQPYTASPSYTYMELEQAAVSAGIRILEDEYVEIGEDIVLAGRSDAAWGATRQRPSVEEILTGADRDKFIIMADHQPVEAEENDAQGVDLLLSGHTHAGQIWPTGYLTEFSGALNYGEYQKGNCKVIVSSGVAGWKYTIRTGEHCEYVVADVEGNVFAYGF